MGKKKTTVGTAISRVIEDDLLPNAIKNGVTHALYKDGEIVDHVLEQLVSSIGTRAERMYEYAHSGAYAHGLPSGQFTTSASAYDEVLDVLETLEGASVTIEYLHYGAPNNLHIGWKVLLTSHGYSPATNQLGGLTTSMGTPVYLQDMVVVVPASEEANLEHSSLEQWGISPNAGPTPKRLHGTSVTRAKKVHSPVEVEDPGTVEYLRVEYCWLDGEGEEAEFMEDSFTIPVAGYDDELDYFQVKYKVGSTTKYWIYEDGAGTYPVLDALFDRAPATGGSFFPFAYFRWDFESEIDNPTTEEYLTSKKLVKYLGMDYDRVAEGINSNPDIDDVKQAMMIMAVPANTANEHERRYLFDFFESLYMSEDIGRRFKYEDEHKIHKLQTTDGQYTLPPASIVIQDSRFKLSLNMRGIYKRRVLGTIGAIGKHDSGFTTTTTYTHGVDSETGVTWSIPNDVDYHYYRRQVSVGVYEEIQVVDLTTKFHIFGKYSATGDDEDKILIIPLDRAITSAYSIPDREVLYARSLHYVFNSVVVTKVKWYQTGIFKVVMIIVAIVISIWTMGTGTTGVLALLAAGDYAAAALVILEAIVTYAVATVAFKLFVKAVGIKIAIIAAVVAAVAGIAIAINAGGLTGTPFAQELLSVSSGLSKAVEGQIQLDIKDLVDQAKEFDLYKEEQIKILESAKELLENDN